MILLFYYFTLQQFKVGLTWECRFAAALSNKKAESNYLGWCGKLCREEDGALGDERGREICREGLVR